MLTSRARLTLLVLLHVAGLANAADDMCKREHALSCAGGGFRAYSTCAGLLSGFLTATEDGSLDELFEDVDVVSGISGGSWWLSGLMYSGEMPAMHEAMAKMPSDATDIFNTAWSQKTAPPTSRRLDVEEHLDPMHTFFCPALGARGSTAQWERYVLAPTSLPGDATLSTKPNRSFAEGKLFTVLASVPQPGSMGRWENEKVWVHVTFEAFDFSVATTPKAVGPYASMYYSAKSPQDEPLPLWAPTKWSFVIGDGEDAKSPLPFCGEEDCHDVFLEYTGYTENATFSYYSPPISEIFKRFEEMAGATPLNTLMDTSSAALASTVLEPEANGLPATNIFVQDLGAAVYNQWACRLQASWIDRFGHGYPSVFNFQGFPMEEITPELVNMTAHSGLQGVNDGAWTDNTGVTAALAALTSAMGCDDERRLSVTALLNGEEAEDVIQYFGIGDVPPPLRFAGFPNLFNGSNKPHGYVCGSPSYEEVLQEMTSRSNAVPLPMPPVNVSTRLHGIYYGTFKCMTVENEWYGVKGGYMVDINWIWAESEEPASPVGGWSFESVARFGELAGEIVQAMVEEDETTKAVAGMFFPKSEEDLCDTSSWVERANATVCGPCKASVPLPPEMPGVTCELFCAQVAGAKCGGAYLIDNSNMDPCAPLAPIGCNESFPGEEAYICECEPDLCKTNTWPELFSEYLEENPPYLAEHPFRSPESYQVIPCGSCKALHSVPRDGMTCAGFCSEVLHAECEAGYIPDLFANVPSNPCEDFKYEVGCDASSQGEVITQGEVTTTIFPLLVCECGIPGTMDMCEEEEWDDATVCEDCKVQTVPSLNCWAYCLFQANTGCKGAYYPTDNETCAALVEASCFTFAFGDELICECEAPVPPLDFCYSYTWPAMGMMFPDLSVEVCDEACTVQATRPEPDDNCNSYCNQVINATCEGSWLPMMGETCKKGEMIGCDEIREGVPAYICQCGPPGSYVPPPPSDMCKREHALTCAGGGFRAYSTCAGMLAGILTVTPEGSLDELFGGIDVVSAISGGSWWLSGLMYSGEMPAMHEAMAKNASNASQIFNTAWSQKTSPQTAPPAARRLDVEEHLDPMPSFICPALGARGSTIQWERYVQAPTSLPGDATLSMKPNRSFAEGKLFAVLASVPQPGSGRWADEKVWVHVTATGFDFSDPNLPKAVGPFASMYYSAKSAKDEPLPLWAPTKWSFVIGDEEDAKSPLPFCGEEDCHHVFLEYTGYTENATFSAYSAPISEIFKRFEEMAGATPLNTLMDTSSAALASTVLEPEENGLPAGNVFNSFDVGAAVFNQALCEAQASWIDRDGHGYPDDLHASPITPELVNRTAYSGLQGVNDGAWTDNTGVTAALAALTSAMGCYDDRPLSVTALLNGEDFDNAIPHFGIGDFPPPLPYAGLPNLFNGSNKPHGYVCGSPSFEEVMQEMGSRRNAVPMPVNASTRLHGLYYGTFKCMTVDNDWYGVKGGFMVDINWLWAESAEPASPEGGWSVESVARFGELAGEIVGAMVYSDDVTRDAAHGLFPRGSFPDPCNTTSWPMLYPALTVCGSCEAQVFSPPEAPPEAATCETFCNEAIDATCEGAWLPVMFETCEKGEMIGCGEHRPGYETLICECGAPGSYVPPPPPEECKREHALTCAGGGFRAYSTCAGLLSGFLTATQEGSLDELFKGVDVVSAISGGSWWLSGLMYSGEMPAMHEAMAKMPSDAGEIFNTAWSQKTAVPASARRLDVEEHLDPFPTVTCPALGPRGSTLQWERYVQGPTSLPGNATLSMKPNRSFAEGKLFAVLASVPQPGSPGRWENEKVWVHVTAGGFDFSDPNLPKATGPYASMYYSAKSGKDEPLPLWAPAKWSFVIGDDYDDPSPLPFCGQEDCQEVFLEYTGYTENATFSAYSPPLSEIFKRFEEMAGATPLNTLMDTSSAALASTVLEPEANGLPEAGIFTAFQVGAAVFNQLTCIPQASWIDREGHGYPSILQASPVTPELVNSTAYSGLQGVNDGAWTDNTGVTAALAALTSAMGCNDDRSLSVTALLNGEESDNAIPFFGIGDFPPPLPYAGLPNLFNGSNKPHGYVCGSPSFDEVMQVMGNRSNYVPLPMPPVNVTARLHGIYYGSFKCMTVDNEWYGVKGGFMVDINWIWAESAEPASPEGGWSIEGVARFGELAGEIVDAMVYSDEVTRGAARALFPRGSFEDPCMTSSWPMIYPNMTVCGTCEAYVQIPPFVDPSEGTCESFCNGVGDATCVGSWLPAMGMEETCERGMMLGCDEYNPAAGAYICECGPRGSFDSCMTDEWEGIVPEIGVCAHCQVAVPNVAEYGNCWDYCNTVNRTCESALISKGFPDVCAVEDVTSCFDPLMDQIALCQCSEEQTYDPCQTYNWPDVKDTCEFCRPSIGNFYEDYGTCEKYCHGLGRSCQGAWAQMGYEYACNMGMPYQCDALIEADVAICECSLEPLFERVPQLLFRSSGLAGAYDNMWPGWSMRGYLGTTTDGKSMLTYGKQPAYDDMCLHGLTFRDANGTFATYTLTGEYYGMTLLEIVKKCMPMGNETMNTGMGPWEDGHCDGVGYLVDYNMPDYFHPELRLFVGHGMMEDNWAIFMPIWPKGGDFQEYDTWAFASKGETCTGYQNMVYIEGFATYKCYEMYEGDDDDQVQGDDDDQVQGDDDDQVFFP